MIFLSTKMNSAMKMELEWFPIYWNLKELLDFQIISGKIPEKVWKSVCIIEVCDLQSLAIRTDFLGFSIQNAPRCKGKNLIKSYGKSTIFISIACTNVESFSMSFGCKISSGSGDLSCQIFYIHFSLLKLTFLVLSNLKACNSKTIENFGTKTHW